MGAKQLDINYLLSREQVSLHRAATSPSRCARAVHRAFAKAYGNLLAASLFPHAELQLHEPGRVSKGLEAYPELAIERWENEGGTRADGSSEFA